jgi:peroxiredoxin
MKKLLIALCIFNVLIIGLLVYKTKYFNNKVLHMRKEMNRTKSGIKALKYNFQTCLTFINKYEASKLPKECELKFDVPKLVFRFTDYSCDHCIEQQISLLNELSKKIDSKRILIVVSTKNKRNIKALIRRFGITFPVVSSEFVIKEVDQYSLPYYFVLDPSNEIKKLFLPDVMFEDTSRQYLKAVSMIIRT